MGPGHGGKTKSPKKRPTKARKLIQRKKFGENHLDLIKYPDNEYLMHLCVDASSSFGMSPAYISLSHADCKHITNRLHVDGYAVVTIFTASDLLLVS